MVDIELSAKLPHIAPQEIAMTTPSLPTYYDVGLASVESGETAFTITGSPGEVPWGDDLLFLPSQAGIPPQRVASFDAGTGELAFPWPGTTESAVAYEVRYVGMIERSTAQSRKVLEQLGQVSAFFDIQVNDNTARLALDTAENPLRSNYRVLVSDVGDGTAAIYSKASGVYNDWTAPAPYSGPVGPTGPVGPQGINWTGTYSGVTDYVEYDGVLYNGSSWRALGATTGNSPPTLPTTSNTHWELVARQGVDGAGTVSSVVAGDGISIDSADPTAPVVSADVASQLEAEAGAANDVLMTPLRTAQAIAELSPAPNLHSSIIVNGSMIDSQENGNTLGTADGYYAADQFALRYTAAAAGLSIQRVQSSRSLAGSANKLELLCTTAKASLGASDFVAIRQHIEGSRPDFVAAGWGAAGAKQFVHRMEVTLPAGAYHLHVTNSAADRHLSVPFTATGAAEVIAIVIPGDTSGTWLTGEGTIGMTVDLVLAAGATLTGGTASTWGGTTHLAASTQFNILSNTSNVARLSDVGIKLDPDATGVYGYYRVGEVDAKYRSERYLPVWVSDGTVNEAVPGSGKASSTTVVQFGYSLAVPTCKPVTGVQVSSTAHFLLGDGVSNFAPSGGFGVTLGNRQAFNLNCIAASGLTQFRPIRFSPTALPPNWFSPDRGYLRGRWWARTCEP